jgi:riboflavin synthase
MFTGIIEQIGIVKSIRQDASNLHIIIEAPFTNELKIDQSIAHNGCCLTVVEIESNTYMVTAIRETLVKTNIHQWHEGTKINLERCTLMNGRFDGHIVQGHVDTIAECITIEDQNGSWKYTFRYNGSHVIVEKGSITVNGVSLTVVEAENNLFSVCIIPFTFLHTNFHTLHLGDFVNIEFDIIGKYVAKLLIK